MITVMANHDVCQIAIALVTPSALLRSLIISLLGNDEKVTRRREDLVRIRKQFDGGSLS
jgi:hypothetical protein